MIKLFTKAKRSSSLYLSAAVINDTCFAQTLSNHSGVFTSPNFPASYPNNAQCTWQITVPRGHHVMLTFLEFSLEPGCFTDHVDIRDGVSSASPLKGTFCGGLKPPVMYSSGQSLWVHFVSDEDFTHEGFQAEYQAVAIGMCLHCSLIYYTIYL